MTIEIHNAELESLLQQRLAAGHFASIEDMLLKTFQETQPVSDEEGRKTKAHEAAARIRELRKGVRLERPEGVSLRDYAHSGHRY